MILAFWQKSSFHSAVDERTCLHRLESLCHQFFPFSPFTLFTFSPLAINAKKDRSNLSLFKNGKIC